MGKLQITPEVPPEVSLSLIYPLYKYICGECHPKSAELFDFPPADLFQLTRVFFSWCGMQGWLYIRCREVTHIRVIYLQMVRPRSKYIEPDWTSGSSSPAWCELGFHITGASVWVGTREATIAFAPASCLPVFPPLVSIRCNARGKHRPTRPYPT